MAATPSTPSPLKPGKELWTSAKKLEGRASEGKEALDAMHDHTLTYMRSLFHHAKRRLAEDQQASPSPAAKRATNTNTTTSHQGTSPARHHAAVPQNTPSTTCKKQRRSVAEAAQMAQVKQKVALFESFKGPGSSPPVDAAAGVVTATTTTTATVRGPVHHSSSKYHAVFPGLNLGDTVAGTLMTGVVPRISEEREDEVVQEALQEDEEEEKEEATTAGKKMAPLALDKEMQTGSCRSSTTTTQHITTALQELQLTEGEDGKQAAAASLPSNPTEGKDEEGPEPIIECNHKQPAASASSVARLAAATHHDDEAASTDHSVGGFLGMVQKTLGLGKHRPSIPPAVPPPAVARKPLEPLPPLRPEDTYVMSESDEDGNSHGVEDDSSDEEDQERKRRAQKEIPAWARGQALAAALEKQYATDPQEWVDPDTIFPEVALTCNLEEIFKVRKKRYYKRGSSAMWEHPPNAPEPRSVVD